MPDVVNVAQGTDLETFLISRQTFLEARRKPWERLWHDATRFLLPHREDILGDEEKGRRQATDIYDGTGVNALQLFVDGLHGYMVSPAIEWFRMKMSQEELNDILEVRQWLQDTTQQMYSTFARSNFYDAMRSFLEDGTGVGTANMFMVEDIGEGTINFMPLHPGECYIAANHKRKVDVLHRIFKYTAREAVMEFGKEKLPDNVRQAFTNAPFTEFKFLHCIYPRTDYPKGKLTPSNKPIASVWLCLDANKGDKVMRESGFDESPHVVWRYKLSGREEYGRCPGLDSLPEVMGLNLANKTLMGAAEKLVNPPWWIPAEMEGRMNLQPGGQNYFDNPDTKAEPLNIQSQYPIGKDWIEWKVRQIEEHFKVDFFLMLARSNKVMTATEIIEKQGEKAAILGSIISRFSKEALDPIVSKVFQIEYRAGRIPPPPDIVLEAGSPIDIDYVGPLAQAQKKYFQTSGIRQTLGTIMEFFPMMPDMIDNFDSDGIAREVADANAMPAKLIRSKEDVADMREARAEQEEALRAQEQAAQAAETVKTAAEADQASGGQLSRALEEAAGATE